MGRPTGADRSDGGLASSGLAPQTPTAPSAATAAIPGLTITGVPTVATDATTVGADLAMLMAMKMGLSAG